MERIPFESSAGGELSMRVWPTAGKPKAVVQILHGMAEHIDRYAETAAALNDAGYAVAGHNHLGHGPECPQNRLGYFSARSGWENVITDAHRASRVLAARFLGTPVVLLGHSMGSFVARCYMLRYPLTPAALVLSGTGDYSSFMAGMGLLAARVSCLLGQKEKPSAFVNQLAFAANNAAFKPARTAFDWLSRDEAKVDAYVSDPLCGFVFTGSAFRDLFTGLTELSHCAPRLKGIPEKTPIYIMSGESDPVGGCGKGVRRVTARYTDAGLSDVTMRLYANARHELFNEINRGTVVADLVRWLDDRFAAPKEGTAE